LMSALRVNSGTHADSVHSRTSYSKATPSGSYFNRPLDYP
jgi:hypothetical protein